MHIPGGLEPLFEYGIVEEVVRPLMSGKEAQVYLVISGGELRVAKVYKEAQNRTFKNRAEYTEGRKVRNSRDQRAIGKRTKHGRAQDEAAWRSTEVDMIRRLHAGGVRVPTPHHFMDGVLIMECVVDADGRPAPRLGDLAFDADEAQAMYDRLIREVVRMLCVGVVHGDLSDFNVLVGSDGPVIIDFPQSVDSAHNTNARRLLLRDVDNLYTFLRRFAPRARRMPYAEEMWDLHQRNLLMPETRLGGGYRAPERRVNTTAVLDLIQDANRDEQKRRAALGLRGGPPPVPYEDRRPNGPPHNGAARDNGPRHGGPAHGPPHPNAPSHAQHQQHQQHQRSHAPQQRPSAPQPRPPVPSQRSSQGTPHREHAPQGAPQHTAPPQQANHVARPPRGRRADNRPEPVEVIVVRNRPRQ